MANSIERLNYYEREYLRSFDFIAEQNYHMEMRRRLNVALHLWGIVDGLDVTRSTPVPGVADQFFIGEGMAIDAYGREIILSSPYTLSDDDLVRNRIDQPGRYPLWIRYERKLATPPPPGYRVCDLKDQYTRWQESATILITDASFANPDEPHVFDPLSDDPKDAAWAVRLGTIDAALSGTGQLTITDARAEQRTYVGLRAQRVIAPVASPRAPSKDASLPISFEQDVVDKQNLLVGADFPIDGTKVKPPPADPANFPSGVGNIKTRNLFLLENLFASVAGEWLGLKEYVQTLIPEIVVDTHEFSLAPTGTDPSTAIEMIHLKSILPVARKAKMIASISQVTWISFNDLINTWLPAVNLGNEVQLQVSVGAPILTGGTNNEYDFPVSWTIGPRSNPPPGMLNVSKLTISYVAIFYP